MKTISIIGLGNRGSEYGRFIKTLHSAKAKTVALVDLNEEKLTTYGKIFGVADNMRYNNVDKFFSEKVLSDGLIITTQDNSHYEITKKALECGYKCILLEKPVSPILSEVEELRDLAKEKGALVVVCHVLRYSDHFSVIKKLIREGKIGKIISVMQVENVGYFHFAHSFVRGDWRNEEESSPSILAKCCHDLDLVYWYSGGEPKIISSIGKVNYFNKANAPEGATPYCMGGCKNQQTCPYDAEAFYITDPVWKAEFIKYMTRTVFKKPHPAKAEKRKILKDGAYGRCVFMCDNDVCDEQVVNVTFDNGVTGTLTMNAFSDKCTRETRIVGSLGEIVARKERIELLTFGGKKKIIRLGLIHMPGHIDGDLRTISGFVKLLNGEITDFSDITTIDATVRSHKIAHLAEISRKENGKPIEY